MLLDVYENKVVPTDQPDVDLAVVASEFSAALIEARIDFGQRHEERVRTFLSSLLTRPLVVLTGLSGSGKSQLAAKLGEWLGEGQSLFVPVRPDWTGPEALFGYVDILQPAISAGRRVWSVPEVLAFFLRAVRDPVKPYLLVLDEMNLAHVERYFADFLSGMESGQPVLPNLIQEGDRWVDAPDDANPLPIPRNLFVVGTVNIDETTYMFSPKMLDRSNVLEFRVTTEDLVGAPRPQKLAPAAELSARALLTVAADDSWHIEHATEDVETYMQAMRALHARLSRHSSEFGFRTFYELGSLSCDLLCDGRSQLDRLPRPSSSPEDSASPTWLSSSTRTSTSRPRSLLRGRRVNVGRCRFNCRPSDRAERLSGAAPHVGEAAAHAPKSAR